MADPVGVVQSGQEYDRRHHVLLTYTQQMNAYDGPETLRVTGAEGTPFMDQNPTDRGAALERQYDVPAIQAAAIALPPYIVPTKTRVPLPKRLNSVAVAFNKSSGTGATNYPDTQQFYLINTRGSGQASPHAEAESSAAITPVITADIDEFDHILVNAKVLTFYQANQTSLATCIAICAAALGAAVTDLPIFQDKQEKVRLFGQQVSLRAAATTTVRTAFTEDSNSGSFEWGDSHSEHVGVESRVETLPYTIHESITIASNTDTATTTVTVKADTSAITGPGAAAIGAITNEPSPITLTANGSALFANGTATVGATSPADIPTSGLYLVSIDGQSEEFGLTLIRAVVVDMSQYA